MAEGTGFLDGLASTERALFDSFLKTNAYKRIGGLVLTGNPTRMGSFTYEAWFKELYGSVALRNKRPGR
ncbi:MAG: hypothetical protein FWF71_02360 [Actinomycetia bacterium]|nr:hypothetical protein [Actinomycetes bacterium]